MPQSFDDEDDEDDEDDDEEAEDDEDEEVRRPEEVSRPVPPRLTAPAPRDVSRDTVSKSTLDSVGDFCLRFLLLVLAVVGGVLGSRYACHIRADLLCCSKV